ncbi:tetratricopeptide repeat protein [Acaryochloris sp. CCMEE 5410]|uniref:tetratricopeptide repeat protein n=1 Tax=Acaryochloris sp. CCMEE 5410 TaxID=310037 RepID=UPI0002484D04|nr:tetratricopeptide repeat protein [Acaryochloris sp. CCMEE 5410]KAI9129084.1 hypothetical protein ON05_036605 [Acaryochloris sp. CCMEE 5410]
MSDSCFLEPHQDLYSICLQQLLPIASERVQSVDLDWWNIESFLGLAFHILLSETDSKLRSQVAQIIPLFGAKAVPNLVFIEQEHVLDADLKSLVNLTFSKIEPQQQVMGLIDMLKACEDQSLDYLIAQKLWEIGAVATEAVATLLADPDEQELALRLLAQFQQFHHQQVANLEALFEHSPNFDPPGSYGAIKQKAETLLKAAMQAESAAPRQAVALYTEALQLCSDHAQAYGSRGLLRAILGDPQGAMADFQAAAELFREQGKTANAEIALGYCKAMARQLPHLD